ncbi:hypothetical protein [Pleurocapsa sp. FMAR1]|nr:hypothetical protein [Pleurocapsa sp. FMAR1]
MGETPMQEAKLPSVARRDLGGTPPCAIAEGAGVSRVIGTVEGTPLENTG